MAAERTARAIWTGSLMEGSGRVSATSSGLFADAPVTWASRTEASDGRTSPEELLAAAHAACFAMALSNGLAGAGSPPERLDVTATATFGRTDAGFRVTGVALDVTGRVPRVDAEAFEGAARKAGDDCPISNAVKGNVPVTVTATLAP